MPGDDRFDPAQVRYLAAPGPPRTLTRLSGGAATAVPIVVWAGTGEFTWGPVSPGSVDAALALLLDATNDPAGAFGLAPSVARDLLTRFDPQAGFAVTGAELLVAAGLTPGPVLAAAVAAGEGDEGLGEDGGVPPAGGAAAPSAVARAEAGPVRTRFAASAAPVREAMASAAEIWGLAPLDAAAWLGLDAAAAAAVWAGAEVIEVAAVAAWCRGPVSPFDVWPPAEAHVISDLLAAGAP